MKTVKEFIASIRDEKKGFTFGDPWRFDEKSLTAVLPILRKSKERRAYLVLQEAKRVKQEDTGDINSILVTNNEKKPVFIRVGNIFKGKTQERAVTISRVVMPGRTEKIEVVCIHQSRPIKPGETYSEGITPRSVDLTGQGETWGSASAFQAMASDTLSSLSDIGAVSDASVGRIASVKVDDISSNLKEFSEAIEGVLKKVPFVANQVGIVLLDTKGCAGMEAFNLSDSWKAIKDDVVRREGEKIAEVDKDSVFEYKPRKAKGQAEKVLDAKFKEEPLFKDNDAETIKISYKKLVGEVTILKDKVIHLNLIRK